MFLASPQLIWGFLLALASLPIVIVGLIAQIARHQGVSRLLVLGIAMLALGVLLCGTAPPCTDCL